MSASGQLKMSAFGIGIESGGWLEEADRNERTGDRAAASTGAGARRMIRQRHAVAVLPLSDRQVRRLLRRDQREGAAGLVSRRRGRPSNRRIAEDIKAQVLGRVQERYPDFGPRRQRSICGPRAFASSRRPSAAG